MKKHGGKINGGRYSISPGEYMAAEGARTISTVAGPCLVVCLHSPGRRAGVMGHFILPWRPRDEPELLDMAWAQGSARMEILVGEMVKLGYDRRRLRASVYGAALAGPDDTPIEEGVLFGNMRFLRDFLLQESIPIARDGLGGITRREIRFDVSTGAIEEMPAPRDGFEKLLKAERDYITAAVTVPPRPGDVVLFESEMYRKLMELIPDIVYRIDEEGRFTYVSKSVFRLGYEPEELVGRHFSVILHPEEAARVSGEEVLPLFRGRDTDAESTPKLFDERRTGRRITRNLRVRMAPARTPSDPDAFPVGEVISTGHYDYMEGGRKHRGTIGIIRDISETANAEMALAQTERFYRGILDGTTDIFFIVAADGTILYAGDPLQTTTGRRVSDTVGENMPALIHESDRMPLEEILADRGEPGRHTVIEYRFPHADGRWLHFESTVFTMRDDDRKALLVILHARDITARKQAEERLAAALREKEVLLQEIHHRVKNNLQVVTSLLDMQSSRSRDPGVQDALRDARNRIRSIARVHEKLYGADDLSRINFGTYLRTIIDEILVVFGMAGGVTVDYDTCEALLPLNKAIPLGLVVNEVITNSLKHARPAEDKNGLRITVSMKESSDGSLRLEIGDNGKGMPEELLSRPGAGMGMKLIRLLAVEQMKGEVSLSGNGGTRFALSFRR
ncbi:MAG TPA: PAS domain S-box protein [Spirochaetes bacterium]|nr:PAS domain S-box protein [Spirochaetota bacterium]